MSRCHTRGSIVGARKRPCFFNFFIYFARLGCFACFGSFVSVVSFRPFRFVVSGFSTCRRNNVCFSSVTVGLNHA